MNKNFKPKILETFTSINTTKRCFHTTGMVHGSTREGTRYWHGTNKGGENVAYAYRNHFLSCIYGLPLRYNRRNRILKFTYCTFLTI